MIVSLSEQGESPPFAPRAGGDLREARRRIGWSLDGIAAALHIRQTFLEALEAGRINDLPGNAYTLGYLRTYATALGLDPDAVVRRFKAEAAVVSKQTELAFPAPVQERGMPAGAMVLLGVMLAIGVYAGWYRLSGEGSLPAETDTRVPERLVPLADRAVPPPVPAVAPAPPAPVEPPVAQQAEVPPTPAVYPSSAAAAPVTTVAPSASTRPDQARIVLRASADAWMQVRDRTGPVLLTRILHPGDTWEVPPRPNLLLTTGNAGGTDIVVDGVTSPSLGGNGVVRRDLLLDPDLIKDGKLAATNTHANPQ
jgi:cytoskeleton protein RodZ